MIKRVALEVSLGAEYMSEYVVQCEHCGKTVDAFSTFEKALDFAENHGWKDGLCPDCIKRKEELR